MEGDARDISDILTESLAGCARAYLSWEPCCPPEGQFRGKLSTLTSGLSQTLVSPAEIKLISVDIRAMVDVGVAGITLVLVGVLLKVRFCSVCTCFAELPEVRRENSF